MADRFAAPARAPRRLARRAGELARGARGGDPDPGLRRRGVRRPAEPRRRAGAPPRRDAAARPAAGPERVDDLDVGGAARRPGSRPWPACSTRFPRSAFLDVELKGDAHGEATAAVLRAGRGEAPDRALVSSFEPATLDTMRTLLPGWRRWLNAEDLGAGHAVARARPRLQRRLGAVGRDHDRGVPAGDRRGLDVAAWTVRRPATVERLGRLGVVACCVEGEALGRACLAGDPRPATRGRRRRAVADDQLDGQLDRARRVGARPRRRPPRRARGRRARRAPRAAAGRWSATG